MQTLKEFLKDKELPAKVSRRKWEQNEYVEIFFKSEMGRYHGLDENGTHIELRAEDLDYWQDWTPLGRKEAMWFWDFTSIGAEPLSDLETSAFDNFRKIIESSEHITKIEGKKVIIDCITKTEVEK